MTPPPALPAKLEHFIGGTLVPSDFVVVASRGGAPDHPRWYRNVQVDPLVEIEVAAPGGTEILKARARVVPTGPERDRLYAFMTEVWPAFKTYAERTSRVIPVIVREPAG